MKKFKRQFNHWLTPYAEDNNIDDYSTISDARYLEELEWQIGNILEDYGSVADAIRSDAITRKDYNRGMYEIKYLKSKGVIRTGEW